MLAAASVQSVGISIAVAAATALLVDILVRPYSAARAETLASRRAARSTLRLARNRLSGRLWPLFRLGVAWHPDTTPGHVDEALSATRGMIDALIGDPRLPASVRQSVRPVLLDLEVNLLTVQAEYRRGEGDPNDRTYFEGHADALDDLTQYIDIPWWRVRRRAAEADRVDDFIAP